MKYGAAARLAKLDADLLDQQQEMALCLLARQSALDQDLEKAQTQFATSEVTTIVPGMFTSPLTDPPIPLCIVCKCKDGISVAHVLVLSAKVPLDMTWNRYRPTWPPGPVVSQLSLFQTERMA